MASIVKRGNKYAVVYNYVDENGKRKQKWETVESHKQAKIRKAEIEAAKGNKTFIAPSGKTLADFLSDYAKLYGTKRWSYKTYDAQTALMNNYILPFIGNVPLQTITSFELDKFFDELSKSKAVPTVNGRQTLSAKLVSKKTIERVYKLLHCAFGKAVKWGLIQTNPCDNASIEKTKYKKRDIWTVDVIRQALDKCTNARLYVAMNLAFACSLRIGEVVGLQWRNVFIDDKHIAEDNAFLNVETELARINKATLDLIGEDELRYVFPNTKPQSKSIVVLKTLKTESSVRKVWIPKTLAYILRDWKSSQNKIKELLGSEYSDYDLVICQEDGKPCEEKLIEKSFKSLKKEAALPNVDFHSLRHSSTSYKLKLNHGDIKATQGDTGHAQADMVTEIYSHIIDEDRKINAVRFQEAFYENANPDLRRSGLPTESKVKTDDAAQLIELLMKSPETLKALAEMLKQSS